LRFTEKADYAGQKFLVIEKAEATPDVGDKD